MLPDYIVCIILLGRLCYTSYVSSSRATETSTAGIEAEKSTYTYVPCIHHTRMSTILPSSPASDGYYYIIQRSETGTSLAPTGISVRLGYQTVGRLLVLVFFFCLVIIFSWSNLITLVFMCRCLASCESYIYIYLYIYMY
ncbi:hypothetical protein F4679DRAFT_239105 [Xylaria curta]|nr:hypothetical protein F4679DRAFT_239105 [Xylaria curta]